MASGSDALFGIGNAMSLPHFYLDEQVIALEEGERFELRLSANDAKHARVLRLTPGEHVAVVDAARDYFECEIVSFSDALPVVRISQQAGCPARRPSVMLLQGLAKGDKMDTVIRHATELGVCSFAPFSCERSIVKLDAKKAHAKAERWRAVAKSAAMQSGQPLLPNVEEPMALREACALAANVDVVLVCWEEAPDTAFLDDALGQALALRDVSSQDARVAVVVGPEGGLARGEVDEFLASNACAFSVTLGPSILRTETAGIVAPALVLHALERMAREGGAS